MPEGPEIKRVADELASVLVDEKVAKVTFAFAHLKPYEQKLMGRMVRQVRPRGKALLTEFVGGLTIYSHNQLYGRWVVAENGAVPDTGRQLRLALHTRVCTRACSTRPPISKCWTQRASPYIPF